MLMHYPLTVHDDSFVRSFLLGSVIPAALSKATRMQTTAVRAFLTHGTSLARKWDVARLLALW